MKSIVMAVISILILISIFPIFNIKAESKSLLTESSYKDTLLLYGSNTEYAKLIYNRTGYLFEYVLNAQNLIPNTSYTLVYYPEKETNILCLAEGVSNSIGQMNIKGEIDIPSLPYIDDPNAYVETTTYEDGTTGAKVWLVRGDQINCYDHIVELHILTDVLYPTNLISFSKVE